MNIVVVSDFAHVNGGNAAVALGSAGGLAARGHAVTLFAGAGPVDKRILASSIDVVCMDQYSIADDPRRLRAMVQGVWNAEAARAMAKLLGRIDLDSTVVHVHGWDKVLSSSVVRTALSMGAKVVCTYHDYVSVCPTGGFYNHPKDAICGLRPLSGACVFEGCDRRNAAHKWWRVARSTVQRQWGGIPGAVKHVVVVSDFSRRILSPFFPEGTQVHHVRNMIDMMRAEAVEPESNKPFVMVGRLSREKGPHLLAAVAQRTGWPVRFVGEGESAEEVRRLAPAATLTGWLSRERVTRELSAARALIFPSLWYETEGLVVLEAAALGVPAVVADSCAARDLVVDGETGLYFRGGDAKALQAAIARLEDDQLVRRLGRAAHRHYWRHPRSLENHVADLEEVYAQVLSGH
ncbi:MAG: glycosyltransferase family 4 protein [Nitrospira sp.]